MQKLPEIALLLRQGLTSAVAQSGNGPATAAFAAGTHMNNSLFCDLRQSGTLGFSERLRDQIAEIYALLIFCKICHFWLELRQKLIQSECVKIDLKTYLLLGLIAGLCAFIFGMFWPEQELARTIFKALMSIGALGVLVTSFRSGSNKKPVSENSVTVANSVRKISAPTPHNLNRRPQTATSKDA